MSLITQCPACATLFKVVPDQLRISEGWVRCGQCEEVFDANAQMVTEEPLAPQSEASHPEEKVHPPAIVPDENIEEPEPEPEPEPSISDPALDPLLAKSPAELSAASPGDLTVQMETDVSQAPSYQDQRIEPRLEQLLADSPITFVPLRASPEVQKSPTHAPRLIVLSGLLFVGLFFQWMVHERDRLAALEIGLRPTLTAVCAVLGCQVEPLRQIDAVMIDSSSFVKVRGDAYRLNFVLKSNAKLPLAVPAVELTLTDAQDQALVRKVIFASEFAKQDQRLGPDADMTVSLPLVARTSSTSDRIAGYRLLAFYP